MTTEPTITVQSPHRNSFSFFPFPFYPILFFPYHAYYMSREREGAERGGMRERGGEERKRWKGVTERPREMEERELRNASRREGMGERRMRASLPQEFLSRLDRVAGFPYRLPSHHHLHKDSSKQTKIIRSPLPLQCLQAVYHLRPCAKHSRRKISPTSPSPVAQTLSLPTKNILSVLGDLVLSASSCTPIFWLLWQNGPFSAC